MAQGDTVNGVCGDQGRLVCRWMFDRTSSRFWSEAADWLIDRPFSILLIIVIGLVAGRILRRSVRRFGDGAIARARADAERNRLPGQPIDAEHNRGARRASTLTSVLSSLVTGGVWVTVGLLILGEVGISLGPLLAGAGVVGVVLAFGAQRVVGDFLAGWFMLTEDQFGVGDVIDLGELAGTPVSGTVERVSLRVTTLRDMHGTVWHVPNSEIRRVANQSQMWSRAVLDIEVAYNTDVRQAQAVIQRAADELWHDDTFTGGTIMERPQVLGVQSLDRVGVTIRLTAKTGPAAQWAVARELRLRIKEALDAATISSAGGTVPPSIG
jgi:moderate conductance mechanosensitive channel